LWKKFIPTTNILLPKENPQNHATTKAAHPEGQTNWHWLIKHPVEFSKNNHTPRLDSQSWKPDLGAT
jgi:hypothetical protein